MAKNPIPLNTVEFRPLRLNDFKEFLTMLGEMAQFIDMADECWITRADIDDRAERVDALKNAIFGRPPVLEAEVLLVKNHMEGLCTYYTTFSTYRGQPGLYIEDVYISDIYRDHGLGKVLMARMAIIAELRNCCRMHWVAPKGDEGVNKFYRGLGARLEEGWNSYQQDNGLSRLAHAAPQCAKMPAEKRVSRRTIQSGGLTRKLVSKNNRKPRS